MRLAGRCESAGISQKPQIDVVLSLHKTQNIVLNLVEQTHQFCHFMTWSRIGA